MDAQAGANRFSGRQLDRKEFVIPSQVHRTFRDPAGNVEISSDEVLRSVYADYTADLLRFLDTPLARGLVADGHLVSSEVVRCDDLGALLRHPRVSFISYPWEWPPTLWKAAAKHTLMLCEQMIEAGWILKDATPLNILFQKTKPILVDVLSVQPLDDDGHIWLAYAQFIRTFLLPMIAYAELGWQLQTTQLRRDGIEPEELYAALRWPRRFRKRNLKAITLPTILSRSRLAQRTAQRKPPACDSELTKRILLEMLQNLHRSVEGALPVRKRSSWSDYRDNALHYSEADYLAKRKFVAETLALCQPKFVLDVGCNCGVYSNLAADAGAEVIAVDTDVPTLDRFCEEVLANGKNILPLHVDLSWPTPSTGWANSECLSFLDRCRQRFDTVLMLAVLHHLLLGSQIPLTEIALTMRCLTRLHLIIEWVPPSDVRFQELLRGRDALYTHLTEENFRKAFDEHFTIQSELLLENGRTLFHMTTHS